MSKSRPVYTVELAGLKRDLPLFEVKPGLRIAILNILGDTALVQASAKALSERLVGYDFDVIVTAESKSIPLAHALSLELDKPYIVLRKAYKFYMGEALHSETVSITTGVPQTLYLDEKDRAMLKGKKVLLLDDVVSTGSTLEGMRNLMAQAEAIVAVEAAICTEGDQERWKGIVALHHLPLFVD
ncbi:MAG: phosphoribosyltransferase family protein [Thermanaerothrix sp.]|uniref:Phosphoribosyltransferase family protein n=1 Tax=Thermanaerothrix solaris TaxID=3058434 RepID=A0ABU3NN32_9CHLR|nr:phosphoribosyltransferase family protein [Thermanaerothrix sp. 4228-RoL]MDT8897377.1 phosphoribosyltransferase family protein [Thermanaerothrix sp. 4228-RoL]